MITPGCPLGCLKGVISRACPSVLARARGVHFVPPKAVGNVLMLYGEQRLRHVGGLGRRRISETGARLVYAGMPPA